MILNNQIHFSIQGKGGIGKSAVAALLSQYIKQQNADAVVIDTDPVNSTLSGFSALNPIYIKTMEEKDGEIIINPEKFDLLIQKLSENESPAILDVGASNYVTMKNYLLSNGIFDILAEEGKELYFHVPIAGGQAFIPCIQELAEIAKFPNAKIVIWANYFFGDLSNEDGKDYTESKPFKDAKKSIVGIVTLEKKAMHSKDLNNLFSDNLTFDEAALISDNPTRYGIVNKSRLKTVKAAIWQQLDDIFSSVE